MLRREGRESVFCLSKFAVVKDKENFRDQLDFMDEPDSRHSWASFGVWRLVGNGKVTNDKCGKFVGFRGCVDGVAHASTVVDGESFKGKAFICLKHRSCFKPDCPTCYLAWANREARMIEGKFEVLSLKYGVVDHVVSSLPESDYGLAEKDFSKLVAKQVKVLKRRGIVGGVLIFHGFRYADWDECWEKGVPFGWRWSPHFHVLGFVRFATKCRNCTTKCGGHCDGFYAQVSKWYSGWREVKKSGKVVWHKGDGYVVNLKDKRRSVVGTAWYQLNHASIIPSVVRFRVARWFGVCAREKIVVPKHEDVCPICGAGLVHLFYFGKRDLRKDLVDCKKGDRRFFDDLEDEFGGTLWCEDTRMDYGSVRVNSKY